MNHGQLTSEARAAFTARFGGEPAVLGCAPGRVELLGNHTDYNGGLVMAAAIDRFDRGRRPTCQPAGRRRSTRSISARPTTSRSTRSTAPRPAPGPGMSAASAGP